MNYSLLTAKIRSKTLCKCFKTPNAICNIYIIVHVKYIDHNRSAQLQNSNSKCSIIMIVVCEDPDRIVGLNHYFICRSIEHCILSFIHGQIRSIMAKSPEQYSGDNGSYLLFCSCVF